MINPYRVRLKTIAKYDRVLEERLWRIKIVPIRMRTDMMAIHLATLDLSPTRNISHWIKLPSVLRGYVSDLYICTTEWGGSGRARVVCGPRGNALRPSFLPRRPAKNGDHAFFYLHWTGAMVVCRREAISVSIYRIRMYSAPFEAQVALTSSRVLPRDALSKLFEPAIQAARSKSNCPKCTHVHYRLP